MKDITDIKRIPPLLFPCDTPNQSFDLKSCRWSWDAYKSVLGYENAPDSILGFNLKGKIVRVYISNTVLYATVSSILVVLLAAGSGYAFSRYRFHGSKFLLNAILAINGVPFLTNLVGLYQMGISLRKTNLPIGDRTFLIFVYIGIFLPLCVWIAKGFFDAIPHELEEAALIDGCSPLMALVLVIMPLATPGLISIFLLNFVNVWNEFLAGYLLIEKNALKPVQFGLYDYMGQNTINIQGLAASCIIIALPVIILFIFFRDRFFTAMVEGSIKG